MSRLATASSTFRCLVLALTLGALGATQALAADAWTTLRGPNHDGGVDGTLFADGSEPALAVTWIRDLGPGYSTLAVVDGKVYAMFMAGADDVLAAFDAESGDEIWRRRIADAYPGHDGSHDGPIASPVVHEGTVFAVAPRGEMLAVDAASGEVRWSTHLVDQHGGQKPWYGYTSTPVVVDGVLVLALGGGEGKAVAGFDVTSGALAWSAGDDEMSYQSPIVADLGGTEHVVIGGPATLWSLDPKSGVVRWSYAHEGDERAMGGGSMVPVPVADDRLFLPNRMDSSKMIRVTQDGDGWQVEELWSKDTLKNSYVVPVVHGGALYGMNGRILTAIDAETGDRLWRSRQPGDAFPTRVGDHLVLITKPGSLHVAKTSRDGYEEVTSVDLFGDHSWSAVAYAGGSVYARSMGQLARIDPVRSEAASEEASAETEGSSWVDGTAFGAFLAGLEGKTDAEKTAAVDAYLGAQKSFPIIEDSGAVHFVYRGEAQDVGIVGDMIGFRRQDPLTRVEGTDFFYYSARLEPDAALTYGFLVDYAEDAIPDPRNPEGSDGPFGEVSWLAMPAWEGPAFDPDADVEAPGLLESFEWQTKVTEEPMTWTAKIYLPAGYDSSGDHRYPVLYVNGGVAALESGHMQAALDQLLGGAIEPMIVVFVEGDAESEVEGEPPPRRRIGSGENYAKLIGDELVPAIDAKYRTRTDRMSRALSGHGQSAVDVMSVGFRRAELFGKLAMQSPPLPDVRQVAGILPGGETLQVLYFDWGTYHIRSPHEAWSALEGNRALWALLREKGHRPSGGEFPDCPTWRCLQSRTDDWLRVLFPYDRLGILFTGG